MSKLRILLDECVDEKLRHYFPNHDCQSARYAGYKELENGELLDAAEAAGFNVLLTVDKGIAYQQNLAGRRIALIVCYARSATLANLLPLIPECLACLETIQPGDVVKIPAQPQ